MDEVELVSRRVGKGATHFHRRFQGPHWALRVGLRAGDGNVLRLHIVLRAERRLNRRELRLQSSGNGRLIAFRPRQHSEVGIHIGGSGRERRRRGRRRWRGWRGRGWWRWGRGRVRQYGEKTPVVVTVASRPCGAEIARDHSPETSRVRNEVVPVVARVRFRIGHAVHVGGDGDVGSFAPWFVGGIRRGGAVQTVWSVHGVPPAHVDSTRNLEGRGREDHECVPRRSPIVGKETWDDEVVESDIGRIALTATVCVVVSGGVGHDVGADARRGASGAVFDGTRCRITVRLRHARFVRAIAAPVDGVEIRVHVVTPLVCGKVQPLYLHVMTIGCYLVHALRVRHGSVLGWVLVHLVAGDEGSRVFEGRWRRWRCAALKTSVCSLVVVVVALQVLQQFARVATIPDLRPDVSKRPRHLHQLQARPKVGV